MIIPLKIICGQDSFGKTLFSKILPFKYNLLLHLGVGGVSYEASKSIPLFECNAAKIEKDIFLCIYEKF